MSLAIWLLPAWVRSCTLQDDKCLKHSLQCSHVYGFSPLWVRSCCLQLDDWLKHFLQYFFFFIIYLFKETHTNYLHCSYSTYNTTLNTYSTYNTMLNTYSTYNTMLNTYSTYNTTLNTYSTYNTIQYSTKQYNTILTLFTILNLPKYKDTLTLHNAITYTITIAIKKTLLTKRKENKHRG